MGIVLWHVTMSLDSFVAGRGDSVDWVFEYAGPNAAVDDVIRTTGALLVGRRTYDVGSRERQSDPASPGARPYGGAWSGPQFVLTHEAPEVLDDPAITFLSEDIAGAVGKAKAAAAGKNVVLIGADVARQAIEAGLVDEILIQLTPVLLGEGTRLFYRPGAAPISLEQISLTQAGQITNLRYRVKK